MSKHFPEHFIFTIVTYVLSLKVRERVFKYRAIM